MVGINVTLVELYSLWILACIAHDNNNVYYMIIDNQLIGNCLPWNALLRILPKMQYRGILPRIISDKPVFICSAIKLLRALWCLTKY
jgi:hypothetical protein